MSHNVHCVDNVHITMVMYLKFHFQTMNSMEKLQNVCSVNCRGTRAQLDKPVGVLVKIFKDSSTEVSCPFHTKNSNGKKKCAVNRIDECVFAKEK